MTAIPALDGLRACSILLVLATHMLPLGFNEWMLNETTGLMGMSLFFALSGFLVTRTLMQDTIIAFMVRRLARVLPLAYLFLLFVAVLFGQRPEGIFAGLAFILNYRPDLMLPVTEHLWSLCVELHFYFAVACIVAIRRSALWLVWPACIAITALRVAEGAHASILTHLRVDEILVGACVATLSRATIAMNAPTALSLWGAGFIAWIVTSHPLGGDAQYFRPYAAGALLFATLYLPAGRVLSVLESRPLKYIATISYALYVVHPLTTYGWFNSGTVWERYLLKRPLSFAMTFGAAHLSTFFWERWWNEAARRRLRTGSWQRTRDNAESTHLPHQGPLTGVPVQGPAERV
jgi:peptidoglycan/LPS O-acetylase OafA/YrhL